MRSINKIILILFFPIFTCCIDEPPTEYASQLHQQVESYKKVKGSYPKTIQGNLIDKDVHDIHKNDFFYIVDSTGGYFTLKVFIGDGLSDLYDSRKKNWVRSDK